MELVQQNIVEEIVDTPVPQTVSLGTRCGTEHPSGHKSLTSDSGDAERKALEHTVDETVGGLVSNVAEETTEIAKIVPQERVQNRTVEPVMDAHMPQIQEELSK